MGRALSVYDNAAVRWQYGDGAGRGGRGSILRFHQRRPSAMTDQIRYDLLTQQALRGVVRSVLTDTAKKGVLLLGMVPPLSGLFIVANDNYAPVAQAA